MFHGNLKIRKSMSKSIFSTEVVVLPNGIRYTKAQILKMFDNQVESILRQAEGRDKERINSWFNKQ
jgi:hypothetical protein